MTTTSGLRSLPAIEKAGSDEVHGVQIGLSPPGLAPEPFGSVIHYKVAYCWFSFERNRRVK